jgi:hypothetical protein
MVGNFSDLSEDEPRAVLNAISDVVDETDVSEETFVKIASKVALEHDINLFRVMNDNPDETEEILGFHPDFSNEIVSMGDIIVEW